jgi:hypothetical protein
MQPRTMLTNSIFIISFVGNIETFDIINVKLFDGAFRGFLKKLSRKKKPTKQ